MNAFSALPLIVMLCLPLLGGTLGYYDKDTAVILAAAMGLGYLVLKFVGFAFKAVLMGAVGIGALLLATGTPPYAIMDGAIDFAKNTASNYFWGGDPEVRDLTEIAKTKIGDELAERGISELKDIGQLRIDKDGKLTAKPEDWFAGQ